MLVQHLMKYYRSRDDRRTFCFLFCLYSDLNTWRIYIINDIPYCAAHANNFHLTHRLHDRGEDYDYICWGGAISTIEQAMAVASLWADTTSIMLDTGRPFDTICQELKNQEED